VEGFTLRGAQALNKQHSALFVAVARRA